MNKYFLILLCSFSLNAYSEDLPPTSSSDEFEKGFGASSGLTTEDKDTAEKDRLKIGGALATDFYFFSTYRDATVSMSQPNSLWIYLDARLRNDIRGYFKGRAVFDSTSLTTKTGLSGQEIPASRSDIEELKLQFNAHQTVFFTIGKQKIKWGSARFWNPTDVLNSTRRDILYSDDRRSGVNLVKSHIPLGQANAYVIQLLNEAAEIKKIGHAARVEIPIATSELTLSVLKPYDTNVSLGADVSAALGPFDVYAEAAYSKPDDHVVRWTSGINYEMNYSDVDSFNVTLEYFSNGSGEEDIARYQSILFGGAYVPYYLSKHYGMLMLMLPNPGSWNQTTFTLFNLLNITDKSAQSRFMFSQIWMQDLKFELSFGVHYGKETGEFRFGNQLVDVMTRLMIDF